MKNKKKNKKPQVYVAMCGDIIHHGHINILKIAYRYGDVTLGLLSDRAIKSYKKDPLINFKHRKFVFQSIKYIKKIVKQNQLDYVPTLKRLKPNYVVHGDDWKKGVQKKVREKILVALKKWNGKLIEPRYTKKISSSLIKKKL
ncbi:adenylyltransferase/cytidyltransferase family protein [Pelagibacterales bacterium SAG-MED39]|nr:adenylyltransferase/cytidyltransferase family protein [Pelagibacterales bacterium SAG-MED39]